MGYWLGITFSCLDVLCVAVFCDAFLERKTRGLRFVVGALLCGVLSYIATIFVSHISEESPITLLKFAALITVYFVFASLFYLGKFWMRLLVVLLAYAIFTLLEFCVLYSLLALLHIHYDEYVSNMVLYFTGVTITYSLKFLLSSAIKRIHRPVVASSGNIKWAPLTIGFPLISLVGITIYYYSSVLQSFRDDMQCCCGERLYWYPKTHQWYCRHCGMWSNRIRPEELSQQLREKLFWICRHNERICSPQGASNIHSIESSRLSHEINTLLASPEPDAESIVRKILHRAELQFTCCSAGDADPATLQIKRACNELEPTDTFPLKLYAEIVSNVILYRDTHIEIKLRNGQIL